MSGTVILLAVLAALLAAGFLLLLRKRKGEPISPGSKRSAAHTNPVLKTISHQITDELQLPSKEFRQELGSRYPDLAMAFRQSFNFGVTRYTQEFWQTAPTEALIPDIVNRMLCDYYGFILPRNFSMANIQGALSQYFKQKKILQKAVLDDAGQVLTITEREAVAGTLDSLPGSEEGRIDALSNLLGTLFEGKRLYRFRQTERETGFVLLSPEEHTRLDRFERVQTPVSL